MSNRLDAALRTLSGKIVGNAVAPASACLFVVDGHRYEYCAGQVALTPAADPDVVVPDSHSLFDCASLTKVIATWPILAALHAAGTLDLDDRLGDLFDLPGLPAAAISVRQILTHTSPIVKDSELAGYQRITRTDVPAALMCEPLGVAGTDARYVNRGYLLLGYLIERLTGEPLDLVARARVWAPLGMSATAYGPFRSDDTPHGIAPTKARNAVGGYLCGAVHDRVCRRLGGICGHVGVFSTLRDLETFMQAITSGDTAVMISPEFLRLSRTPLAPWRGRSRFRSLGWAVEMRYARPVIFHDGFTGVSLYWVPESGDLAILLTNSVYERPRHPGLDSVREHIIRILGR